MLLRLEAARFAFVLSLSLLTRTLTSPVKSPPKNSSLVTTVPTNLVNDGQAAYTGSCSSDVCSWKGVRYAQSPTGSLRFAAARAPTDPKGVVDATQFGSMCLQLADNTTPAQSEDCLYANIYRPANIARSTKLPVLIYVHGGGFQSGAGSNQDPTTMVSTGASSGLPVIVITINYRLGAFGFLGGSTFLSRQRKDRSVSLNAAYTDVRQAVRWTRKHIAAFGGDREKITLWGQSAGSFLTAGQLLGFPSAQTLGLQGVILESGSPNGVPVDPASAKDGQYNDVVKQANCAFSADTIACLRGVDSATLRTISNAQANLNNDINTTMRGFFSWTMMQDGGPANGGFYADRPSELIKAGRFAKLPLLHGDCYDEGTYFAYQGSNDTATTIDYFKRIYFNGASDAMITKVFEAYPDDPPQGSPFKPHSGDYNNRYHGDTNQYKRIAALYGDVRYQANRRFFLQQAAKQGVRAFSYQFAQYIDGADDSVGYPHGSDLSSVFGTQSNNAFGDLLTRQWLSFAVHKTPNRHGRASVPQWPAYTTKVQQNFYYANDTTTVVNDDFRQAQFALLNTNAVLKVTGR